MGKHVFSSNLIGRDALSENTTIALKTRKQREWLVFLFLAVCLAPILAVALVGSWGFIVWFSQMIYGPPVH
ncbi:hypothetical protein DS909_05755 [Phaeobacter gallaeciensis]|uniref:Nitrate reductase n=2 Tax=Roseobacteraceae TaxID=2854170 RepID=A0A366X854_9RHOB|nr:MULTISPECIES: periplasmic nitrate reductase, NapE protein [Roseobacteraceae]MBT3139697.1 periplasmic nitrate reductase, NapE protein [Falsiruegeria litorea]MBT8169854.1 periplasmic nitrate reductase, NapE protein [Falsiruegeria litorea]RBW58467.1 hypothetical protein DS909_05755 [Phaeobacter gallaeciensis]